MTCSAERTAKPDTCTHLDTVEDVTPSSTGCEDWWYCYPDDLVFEVDGGPASLSHP